MVPGSKVLTYIDEQEVYPQGSESWASSQFSFLWATQMRGGGGGPHDNPVSRRRLGSTGDKV